MTELPEITERLDRINIKIAEAIGWTEIETEDFSGFGIPCFIDIGKDPLSGQRMSLPDYCNDLNAMHEAEKVLSLSQFWDYADTLNRAGDMGKDSYIRATARQRAEAFLRTFGKWEES